MSVKGARVLAVVSIVNNVALVLGEGTYVGDEVPDATLYPHLRMFSDNKIANPRINLDSGDTVWGCECWWGDVTQMQKRLESCEIQTTTAAEMRTVKNTPRPTPQSTPHPPPGNYVSDDVQSL